MHGASLGRMTNNISDYSVVIELLSESISFGIRSLIIRLDFELVVLQLNRLYAIKNPVLLRIFFCKFISWNENLIILSINIF